MSEADHGDSRRERIALFVRRPILAFVASALVVLAGIAALGGIEVRELPDVDEPVITITTTLSGASPEAVDREITSVIEGAVGRVPGVEAISSQSSFGRSRVTLAFGDDVDLDVAATDTRDAVARVTNNLPDDVDEPRVVKADADAEPVIRIAVTSATRSVQELTTLVEDDIEDRLISVPGVADVSRWGDRTEIFRVDIDPVALASRGLTLAQVRDALDDADFESPAGTLSSAGQSLVVRTTAAVASAAAFEALRLTPDTRLGDVATVTMGPDLRQSVLRTNGQTGLGLGIIRQARSNTLEISEGVHAAVAELDRTLPEDVSIFVTADDAVFIAGAIHEVLIALGLAVLIVVAVIFAFLRDWRATLIPAVSIPVALIGSIAALYLVGFSVNILTMLAFVLATGMVVDDAIVVLENIVRQRGLGLGPRAAAVIGTEEVFFAVIATTLTLIAVFVPLSFLPGQSGGLFREFGFTLAIAVALSAVVALTLCPVMAARLLSRAEQLHPEAPPQPGRLARVYERTLKGALAAPLPVAVASLLFAATAAIMLGGVRSEVTPLEDRSAIRLWVTAPQGVSLDYTTARMREFEALLAPLRASGEVRSSFIVAGQMGLANRAFVVLTLAPWEERERSQAEIAEEVEDRIAEVIGVRAFTIQPNSLGIRGAGHGLQVALLGSDYPSLAEKADRLLAAMEAEPAFGSVRLSYETNQPQLFVEVDRERATDLGIAIDGLGEALQAMLDGRNVGEVFVDDRAYDVKMVSTARPVNDPADLENIFVQTASGRMVPVSTVVRLEERAVSPQLTREGQMRSVAITAGLTPNLAVGAALERVEALAEPILDGNTRLVPLAEAATLDEASSGLATTFGLAVVVVFLVLAAQFESLVSALIVMATVPLGLACAVFALVLTGGSLNVYSQIGLVLLVGIMAKNSILIVEFADQLRDRGRPVRAAIEEATRIRLRPVLMTMIATVLGGVPLILSGGAGAEARHALGWIIVGGLGPATLATLYLTPVAYLLLAGLARPRIQEEQRLRAELAEAGAG
jgi:hydrophobic/amphiphilic exporter-1 (mainly G- bacteria), HAE1 family